MMGWIKDDLGASKQGKTRQIYPKYAARGKVWGRLGGVLEGLGVPWAGFLDGVKDDGAG